MDAPLKKFILAQLQDYSQEYLNEYKFSQKYKNHYLKNIQKGLEALTSCFYRYGVTQGHLDFFDYAVPSKDLAKEFIAVLHLHSSRTQKLKDIKNTFRQMMAHYPKRKHLVIGLHPHQKDLIKLMPKLSAKITSYELVGTPKAGLDSLTDVQNDRQVKIRPVNAKKDLEKILALEIKAHRADQSSRIKVFGQKFKNELLEHHKNMAKMKSSFVAEEKGKIIGVIGTLPHKPIAILATVSVDPKHQGRGLSKVLYKEALQDLKSRRCPFYKGMTTTRNVLSTASKMGRKVSTTYYEIDGSLMAQS